MKNRAKTALFYALVEAIGIIFFICAHKYATVERGYEVYGGEVLLLLLPVFAWVIRSCLKDVRRAFKDNGEGGGEPCQKRSMRE